MLTNFHHSPTTLIKFPLFWCPDFAACDFIFQRAERKRELRVRWTSCALKNKRRKPIVFIWILNICSLQLWIVYMQQFIYFYICTYIPSIFLYLFKYALINTNEGPARTRIPYIGSDESLCLSLYIYTHTNKYISYIIIYNNRIIYFSLQSQLLVLFLHTSNG